MTDFSDSGIVAVTVCNSGSGSRGGRLKYPTDVLCVYSRGRLDVSLTF